MQTIADPRDTVTVRSPEGVELTLPIATPAPRIAAYAIDFVFVAIIAFGLLVLLIMVDAMSEPIKRLADFGSDPNNLQRSQDALAAMAPLMVVLMIVFVFGELLYFGSWEVLTRGRTPGKYLLGLRVVGAAGEPLTVKAALLRNVLRAVDTLPASYAVGLVTMIMSERGQRIGDHAAGTLVIRTDRVERPQELALPDDLEPLALSREQLARLGVRELSLARNTLRRFEATAEPRYELLQQAAEALVRRLELPPEHLHDPRRLLQRVLVTATRSGWKPSS